jgi:hypothetical protein
LPVLIFSRLSKHCLSGGGDRLERDHMRKYEVQMIWKRAKNVQPQKKKKIAEIMGAKKTHRSP